MVENIATKLQSMKKRKPNRPEKRNKRETNEQQFQQQQQSFARSLTLMSMYGVDHIP
jgi:hypothetical protein